MMCGLGLSAHSGSDHYIAQSQTEVLVRLAEVSTFRGRGAGGRNKKSKTMSADLVTEPTPQTNAKQSVAAWSSLMHWQLHHRPMSLIHPAALSGRVAPCKA
eukprot:910830-Rhodomonas_salina.1